MADTGAPWNLPYPLPTDLVRDGAQAIQDLAEAVAPNLSKGLGTNVVQTVKTDTFSTSSTSFVTVTNLTATITPSSATSKVFIIAQLATGSHEATGGGRTIGQWKVTRAGTDIYVGNADGSRTRAVFGGFGDSNTSNGFGSWTIVYLDSPTVGTPVEYRVETRNTLTGGTVYLNRSVADLNDGAVARGASSLTVIEVAP